MANLRIPYLQWRDGRPRWEPGPALRAAGHKGRNLCDPAGRWLGLEAAIEAARAINADIEARRGADGRLPRPQRPVKSGRTCEALWQRWRTSPAFERLGAKTRADYAWKIEIFLAEFGEAPIAAVSKPQLFGLWEELHGSRGHTLANGVLACVSSMFSYAEMAGWREAATNPAKQMRRPKPAERLVLWLPAELECLVATADGMGCASVADAILIALYSGQRQGDVLALPPRLFEEGRIRLTQSKRKALLDCPLTDQLALRVAKIRARWSAAGVASRATVVARESDGQPYGSTHFQHLFAAVRAEAAKVIPAIAGKKFQDLRDTAVTRLALAGCSMPEIGAITGHSQKTIADVLKHYLVMQPEMADAAIAKLQAWMTREGIAV